MIARHPLFDRRLPAGWRVLTVDEVKAPGKHSCVAGPFGSNISSKYFVDSGVPVIRGNNLRDDLTRFVPKGFAFVSEEQAKKYKAQHVRPNDLVFTCWGTLGQIGLIPENGPYPAYIISNKQLKLTPNQNICDPLYLFYYFGSPEMIDYIRRMASSAAVPGINLALLKSFQIAVPPPYVQERIASILSAYDDLIEKNTRRIAILEEIARALYQEWFVHFRFPGHEHVPLVDSPLGPIPEGWEVLPFGQVARVQGRSFNPSQSPLEVFAHYSFPAFDTDQMPSLEQGSEILSNKLHFDIPCVLLAKLNPRIPRIWPVVTVPNAKPICSTEFLPLTAQTPFSPALLTAFCKTAEFADRFRSMALGTSTSHQRVKPRDLEIMPVVVAPQEILANADQLIAAGYALAENLRRQNQNLRTTRDLLLPKLISGEIDVAALSKTPIAEAAD